MRAEAPPHAVGEHCAPGRLWVVAVAVAVWGGGGAPMPPRAATRRRLTLHTQRGRSVGLRRGGARKGQRAGAHVPPAQLAADARGGVRQPAPTQASEGLIGAAGAGVGGRWCAGGASPPQVLQPPLQPARLPLLLRHPRRASATSSGSGCGAVGQGAPRWNLALIQRAFVSEPDFSRQKWNILVRVFIFYLCNGSSIKNF